MSTNVTQFSFLCYIKYLVLKVRLLHDCVALPDANGAADAPLPLNFAADAHDAAGLLLAPAAADGLAASISNKSCVLFRTFASLEHNLSQSIGSSFCHIVYLISLHPGKHSVLHCSANSFSI